MIKKLFLTTATLLLIGCGGGGSTTASDGTKSTTLVKKFTGYYIDSPIVGVQYSCNTLSGYTGEKGEFYFYKGDSCKFSLNGVNFREVNANELNRDKVKIFEFKLSNARVLQTLDTNRSDDKIKLSKASKECLKEVFDTAIPESVTDAEISKLYDCLHSKDNSYNGKAVTEDEAQEHIKETKSKYDTTAPIITLNGKEKVTLEAGDTFIDLGASAIDDIDGDVNVTVSGEVKNRTVGNYTLTYTAVDKAGNKATKNSSRYNTTNDYIKRLKPNNIN